MPDSPAVPEDDESPRSAGPDRLRKHLAECSPPNRVLVASRRRMAVLVALSLVFVVLGAAMAANGSILGWIAVVFFGLGGLACLLFLIRPYRLALTPDDFDYTVPPHSPQSYTWAECGPFRLVTVSRTRIVVFATSRTDHTGMRRMNRSLTGGADANLQAHFRGISPQDLVELMNR